MILEINRAFDKLWRDNLAILASKDINSKATFAQAMRHDLQKVLYGLLAVRLGQSADILSVFFGEGYPLLPHIQACLVNNQLDHVGFAVAEPIDVILQGFERWIDQLGPLFEVKITIAHHLRFPASAAFQARVGAYTEIMRIWLQVGERELMLELFDIHRPMLLVRSPAFDKRRTETFYASVFHAHELTPEYQAMIAHFFHPDPIWHYAFEVNTPNDVETLHRLFQADVAAHERYRVAYPNIIYNAGDASYHTKVIAPNHETELEFVTRKHTTP